MESTRKIGQDRYFLKILAVWSIFVQKSTFGNWAFAQFLSFEWRNGSQNRNVLEKLSGTGPFWKFWLFGQGQGSTWSKHFLFPFFLFKFFFFFFWQAVRTGLGFQVGPGQTESVWTNGSDRSGWWRHKDVIARVYQRMACGSLERSAGACERMRTDGGTCFAEAVFVGASSGAWRRVDWRLGLKFLGLVNLRP